MYCCCCYLMMMLVVVVLWCVWKLHFYCNNFCEPNHNKLVLLLFWLFFSFSWIRLNLFARVFELSIIFFSFCNFSHYFRRLHFRLQFVDKRNLREFYRTKSNDCLYILQLTYVPFNRQSELLSLFFLLKKKKKCQCFFFSI